MRSVGEDDDAEGAGSGAARRRIIGRIALLAITGVSLYLLAPSIIEVFSSWQSLSRVEPAWFAAMVVLQAGSFFCMWALQRLAVRTRSWFAVGTSQLAGNAFGRIVPGGGAAAGALQYQMLVGAGVPGAAAASGLTAASLLTFAGLTALPLLALPALLGSGPHADDRLVHAAWATIAGGCLILGLGAVFLAFDRPLVLVGRAVQAVSNAILRRRKLLSDLPERLLAERDHIRDTLGDRWWEALLATIGKWGLDYLSLLAALAAVGARPSPTLVLLSYCVAQLLGQIPVTPGGLGFVEAGLTGTLALAGVSAGNAVVATLAYRLVSYWLPLPFGLAAWIAHRRRYGRSTAAVAAAGAP